MNVEIEQHNILLSVNVMPEPRIRIQHTVSAFRERLPLCVLII